MPAQSELISIEGVALWRRIADGLRLDIADGALPLGARLPGEAALATRFGVNRHTVRAALKALERDGLVRARQGSGTFVVGVPAVAPGGERFSVGIAGVLAGGEHRLLEAAVEAASPSVAAALWLGADALVTRMETVLLADGVPLVRTSSWFPAERFPAIDAVFNELGSVAAALSHYDITDYVRATTRLAARRADADEAAALDLPTGAIIMVAEGIDALPDGQPLEYSLARFAAERVELVVLGE